MKSNMQFEKHHGKTECHTILASGMVLGALFLMGLFPRLGWTYFGGNGSFQNPYQLATADDLVELSETPKDNHKHFIVVADIDAAGYLFDRAVIGATDDPDLDDEGFYGTLNGNGHVIRNLFIHGDNNVGLIGVLKPDAQIGGIGIVDANIVASGQYTGILVGYNDGLISNCYATGTVHGQTSVGGLVGRHDGEISDCYAAAQITGTHSIGGLSGESWGAITTNCYSASLFYLEGTDMQEIVYGLVRAIFPGSNSFWDAQLNELSGITFRLRDHDGLMTDQMMDANSFLEAGWDFLGETTNGYDETWTMPAEGGYPVLSLFQGIAAPWPSNNGAALGTCTLSNDPNEVLWDSQSVFSPEWESRIVSNIAKNPATNPLFENHPERTIAISGNLKILDANNLLGINTEHSTLCQALDQTGNPIEVSNVPAPFQPRRGWHMLPSTPRPLSIELLLDPDQPMPTALSQVDFFVYSYYARSIVVVDVPFQASQDWIDLVPGLSVQIDGAEYEEEANRWRFHTRRRNFSNTLTIGILTQDYTVTEYSLLDRVDMICNMDFVDQLGEVVTSYGTRHIDDVKARSRGHATAITGGYFTWDQGIEFVRFTIALEPYHMIVPLTLTDIPISSE
jgi:hypothetical protein